MPAISLLKKPEEAGEARPAPKWKLLSYGHMPVKRSINFATVGEKPIDWRIASPSIVLIVLIAMIISSVPRAPSIRFKIYESIRLLLIHVRRTCSESCNTIILCAVLQTTQSGGSVLFS